MFCLVLIHLVIVFGASVEETLPPSDQLGNILDLKAPGECPKIANCFRESNKCERCSQCVGTFDKASAFIGDNCAVACSWRKDYNCWPGVCGNDNNNDARTCICAAGLAGSPACDTVSRGGSISSCRVDILDADGKVVGTSECSGVHYANIQSLAAVKAKVVFEAKYTKTSVYDTDFPVYIKGWDLGLVSAEVEAEVYQGKDRNCSNYPQTDYRGLTSTTITGSKCQSWASQSPHTHNWFLPDRDEDMVRGIGYHNLCRNPDTEESAWCYTTNSDVRWEYCGVSECDTADEVEYTVHHDWQTPSAARAVCQQSGGDLALPRNTLEQAKLNHLLPYRDVVALQYCDDDSPVYINYPSYHHYRGTENVTRFGVECIEWKYVLGGKWFVHKNHCRRLSKEDESLWCFTDMKGNWDYCDVPKCNSEPSHSGTNEIYYTLGLIKEGDKWLSIQDHSALEYDNWHYRTGYGNVGVISDEQSGSWTAASENTKRPFICQNEKLKPEVTTKHEVTCDRPLSANNPVNGQVTCQSELDIPEMEHNGRLSLKVSLNTGGYKDVSDLENSRKYLYRTFYKPFTTTRCLNLHQDSNPPIHCAALNLCSGDVFSNMPSITHNQPSVVTMDGWISLDEDAEVKSYFLEVYKLKVEDGKLVRGKMLFYYAHNYPKPASINYGSTFAVAYLTVTDNSGNSQVSRKLVLNTPKEDVKQDHTFGISAVGACKGHWITDASKPVTIQWARHFSVASFAPNHGSYGIELPLEDGISVLPEYDDLGTGLLSLSVLGKQHTEGIVKFEFQVTQTWEKGPLENWWSPTDGVADNVTFVASRVYTSKVWVRATSIHGTKAVSSLKIYVTKGPPVVTGLMLDSGKTIHNNLDLTTVCAKFTAVDSVGGIETVKYRLLLGSEVIITMGLPGMTCEKGGQDCQCNAEGNCSPKTHSFCLDDPTQKLQQGARYTLELTVSSFAELSTVSELKFDVDSTPPQGGAVSKVNKLHDTDFTSYDSVTIYWSGFYDTESDVERYIVRTSDQIEAGEAGTMATKSNRHDMYTNETPRYLCVSAVNSAGLVSEPVCSTPIVKDVTPPKVNGIRIGDSITQPGLASDGEHAWYVTSEGTRFKTPCSLFSLETERNLDAYPIIKHAMDHSKCASPEFTGLTLLLSRHILDISYDVADDISGIKKVQVGASMTEGSFNIVMGKKTLQTSRERIFHGIGWFVPYFYLNFIVTDNVGLETEVSMGPFKFDSQEFAYTDEKMGCIASSDGIFCTFDIAKVEQSYPHTFNSLAVTLDVKTQRLMGYMNVEIPPSGTPVFLPSRYYRDKLTPNEDTEIAITLRLRNQLNKNIYIACKDTVTVSKESEEPWVIDGEGSLDIKKQQSNKISARWGGFNGMMNCRWAVSTDGVSDDVRLWEEVEDAQSHRVSAYISTLVSNTFYYTMIECSKSDELGNTAQVAVSNGVLFTDTYPLVYRPQISSMYGPDLHLLSATWHAPLILDGSLSSQLLTDHAYTSLALTDTLASTSTATLLPNKTPVRFRTQARDADGSVTEALSALYQVDLTEPVFTSEHFYTADFFDEDEGVNYIIDSSRLRLQIRAYDKDSGIASGEVSVSDKGLTGPLQGGVISYLSPTQRLLTGHSLRDGARLAIQGRTCNGAGMCYSRDDEGYPHKVDTTPPSVPRIRRVAIQDGNLVFNIAGAEDVHSDVSWNVDVAIGSKPYGSDYLSDESDVRVIAIPVDRILGAVHDDSFWISVRGVNAAGLMTSWVTRQFHTKEQFLGPDSCSVRTCNERVEYPCKQFVPCKSWESSGIDITVKDLHNDEFTSSVALLNITWQLSEDIAPPLYTELTVVELTASSDSFYNIRSNWKVIGSDTSALLTPSEPLTPGVPYVVMLAAHYDDHKVIVTRSSSFIPVNKPPTVDDASPIVVSFEEGGLSSPVVGHTLYASWASTFSDDVVAVVEWDVSVGHCKGCGNVRGWQRQNTSSLALSLTKVESLSHLYVNVIAYNEGGLGSLSSSEKVTVDKEKPVRGVVVVESCHKSRQPLAVSWSGFYDIDSFITHYTVQILDRYYEPTSVETVISSSDVDSVLMNTKGVASWKDIRVRVTAVDLFGNEVSSTSGIIYSDSMPQMKSCGGGCVSLPEDIYLVSGLERVIGGVEMRLEGTELDLKWKSDAFRTTVTVTDINKDEVLMTQLNRKPSHSLQVPVCDQCIVSVTLLSQCGSHRVLSSKINIVHSNQGPDVSRVVVSPGCLEEGNIIKAVEGNVTLSWDTKEMACVGEGAFRESVKPIITDSKLVFTNITARITLALTCANKAAITSTATYFVDPGRAPTGDGDIEMSVTPPVLFKSVSGLVPDGSTVRVNWKEYDTNHGPLTYEMIQGPTLQTDWTAMNTSNEALIEQKEAGTGTRCTTVFVRATTPALMVSDVTNTSICAQAPVTVDQSVKMLTEVEGERVKVSWSSVFKNCLRCRYLVFLSCKEHLADVYQTETTTTSTYIPTACSDRAFVKVIAVQSSGLHHRYVEVVQY